MLIDGTNPFSYWGSRGLFSCDLWQGNHFAKLKYPRNSLTSFGPIHPLNIILCFSTIFISIDAPNLAHLLLSYLSDETVPACILKSAVSNYLSHAI
jgi:hypothetical protein